MTWAPCPHGVRTRGKKMGKAPDKSSRREGKLSMLQQQPKAAVILGKNGNCATLGDRLNSNEPLRWEQGRLKRNSREALQPDFGGVKAGGISCLRWGTKVSKQRAW